MLHVTPIDRTEQKPDKEERVRRIIHVDMDAFYASVEQRDKPELRGRPVAVGIPGPRGVLTTASYEARVFGVRSAMPSVTAARQCPGLIFVKPRFDAYRAVSAQIHAIFAEHTDLIEPLSLDEAYLDVTDNKQGIPIATEIATLIRARIKEVTGLNASAGISYCKFLAKMASDLNKPNGQAVITPKNGRAFVEALAVKKFHGIGPATSEKMKQLGILTGADLRAKSLAYLQEHFGKSGAWYYNISRGIDDRPVRPDRVRKSLGAEDTFMTDIFDLEAARAEISPLVDKVWRHCQAKELHGRSVTLKVKYADFQTITRSRTEAAPFGSADEIAATVLALLDPLFPTAKGIRLLGVIISSFGDESASEPTGQLQFEI
jgi:DNA polymerase IV